MNQTKKIDENVKQTNLSSFALWDNASKIILDTIKNKINNFAKFADFITHYNFDDEKAISLLNKCYVYEPNIKIPLLNNDMALVSNSGQIYSSDNIEKDIISFIIKVNKNDTIESELACTGIKHPNVGPYNSSQIIFKINKAAQILSHNQELREDPEIMRLIKKINYNSFANNTNFNEMNEVDKEKLLIFGKLFISNLGPRLRELGNPSESVKKDGCGNLFRMQKIQLCLKWIEKLIFLLHITMIILFSNTMGVISL